MFTVNGSGSSDFFQLPTDGTLHPVPQLDLLDQINALAQDSNLVHFNETIFVGAQHFLETTASLFQSLISLGAVPKKMYFVGKCYSTSPRVTQSIQNLGINILPDTLPAELGGYQAMCRQNLRALWEKVSDDLKTKHREIEKIIIIDDGGRCFEEMPCDLRFKYYCGGVEQTRGGLYSPVLDLLPFPIVEVASSVAKKHIESPFIATAIFEQMRETIDKLTADKSNVFGIVGNGAIGYAIGRYLLDKGLTVLVYDGSSEAFIYNDASEQSFVRVENVASVISNANYIFGCTGKDITQNINVIDLARGKREFISCTSEDKEFLSLLSLSNQHSPSFNSVLDDVHFSTPSGAEIIIRAGGFPVNFNRQPGNVPVEDIALTQGLMLGACLQAWLCATKPVADGKTINQHQRLTLNPFIQQFVVKKWGELKGFSEERGLPHSEALDEIEKIIQQSNSNVSESVLAKAFSTEDGRRAVAPSPP